MNILKKWDLSEKKKKYRMKIDKSIGKIRNYLKNCKKFGEQIMVKYESHIIKENVSQMYDLGQNIKEESLGEYTPISKWIKQQKGQRTDHITLRDTGDFHEKMFMKKTKEAQKESEFEIKSKDWKSDMLERGFPDIFGLNEENLKDFTYNLFFWDFYNKLKLYFK